MKKTCKTLTTITIVIIIFNLFVSSALSQSFIFGKVNGDGIERGINVELWLLDNCGQDDLVGTYTTNSEGNYFFEGLANGSYRVVPGNDYFNFDPVSADFIIPRTDFQTRDFIADRICFDTNGGVRFVDNNDGTVSDSCTGLVWMKDLSLCPANINYPVSYSDTGYLSWIKPNQCGLSDDSVQGEWRLPTKNEWMIVGSPTLDEWHEGDWPGYPFSYYKWEEPNNPADIKTNGRRYHVGGSDGYNYFWYGADNLDSRDAYYGTKETLIDYYQWPVRDPH
jgi:hypothetical protein